VEGICHIQAIANKAGIIKTATAFEGIIFKGVSEDYHWQNIEEYLIEGQLPIFNSNIKEDVLISKFLADRLNLKIGDKFNTFFMKSESNKLPNRRVFTIIGIFNSGFQEFDSTYIIGDIRHIQRINKWTPDQVGSFEVFLEDFNLINQKGAEVYQQTSATLDSQTIEEKYYFIFEWLKLFDFNIIVILILMIAVATINMAVALLVLILERTQMIGMLKALGASNWSIRKIFLYNAFYIIVRGLFWGNLIGIGLVKLQDYFGLIKLNPENYYVNEAPVYLNWGYILALNVGTAIICVIILLIPSYLITKISPIKAIRYD
jgi:lipoprotein-releasing system permease protein